MTRSDGASGFEGDAAWIAVALVLVASLGGAVVLAEWPLRGVQPESPEAPHLVEPSEGGTKLWPYTARAREYRSRTLGINVVLYGDPDRGRAALTGRSGLDAADGPGDAEADSGTISHERIDVDPDAASVTDLVSWTNATGATRYTYVEVDGAGVWMEASYELHDGTYLGHRTHIRAYEDPAGGWTAVQIHAEHWDWFRLRHTVTGISEPQRDLEGEFVARSDTGRVVRVPFGNDTADGDGWASGIHLVGGVGSLLVVGLLGRSRRASRTAGRCLRHRCREVTLGAGLFAAYTAVRWLGIAGESLFPAVSPKIVAAPLYVVLVVGLPALAYSLGRGSDAIWAFAFAALGLGGAIVVDYAAMGTSVVPLRVVLHRGSVVLAVGLLAVGGADATDTEGWPPPPLLVGAAAWAVVIAAPVFGLL
ncbi:hypothetical protein [Natronomonas sp. LN261]|jgi:hypothetical protein|uniref:hypothetical protein n=1 Tax=Natronomonas sp. LN261 TaxID=2750669 RepID=UPI0015EFA031|nr:hypothetical protein [Natronomonas sp. LN261]